MASGYQWRSSIWLQRWRPGYRSKYNHTEFVGPNPEQKSYFNELSSMFTFAQKQKSQVSIRQSSFERRKGTNTHILKPILDAHLLIYVVSDTLQTIDSEL